MYRSASTPAGLFMVPQASFQVFKPRALHSNEERFDRFFCTFLHNTDWTVGVRYFAIYWLRFKDEGRQLFSPLFENGNGRCAEAHLMDHLQLMLSVVTMSRLSAVSILQNSSPCFGCSDRYVKDFTDLIRNTGIPVTVVFSSLHRIQRATCQSRGHQHRIFADRHELNAAGLRKMRGCGIELKTTRYQDWRILRSAMQLPDNFYEAHYSNSQRKLEDDDLRRDLNIILNT